MRSAIPPTIGKKNTCAKTEKEIAYGYKDPGRISNPQSEIIPEASAPLSATEVK